jgi:hypothetical protein
VPPANKQCAPARLTTGEYNNYLDLLANSTGSAISLITKRLFSRMQSGRSRNCAHLERSAANINSDVEVCHTDSREAMSVVALRTAQSCVSGQETNAPDTGILQPTREPGTVGLIVPPKHVWPKVLRTSDSLIEVV